MKSANTDRPHSPITSVSSLSQKPSATVHSSLVFIAIAIIAAFFSDLHISTTSPSFELRRMGQGLLAPEFLPFTELWQALWQTIAYAVAAVSLAAIVGFVLSLYFNARWVRILCVSLRSVHELFWGLLFIQLIGIQPLAGLLAIALPYTGIFAKVYAEMLEEAEQTERPTLPNNADKLSRFLYGKWPLLRPRLASYTLYRLECGLRSSTVLGFIGLPTLGFHLMAAFMQGHYAAVVGLLLILYPMIATLRLWMRWQWWPLVALASFYWIFSNSNLQPMIIWSLFTDMIPAPLRSDNAAELLPWLWTILKNQAFTGAINTLLVAQIAMVLAGVLALLFFPFLSAQFAPKPLRWFWHWVLVVLRSTPELIITFALLLLWGPSMLPAIIAMGIHNGAIIGHLCGLYSDELQLRADASGGINRYFYEVLPRIYGQFLAFLFYRWEVIFRETAVLGILGIHTLGFYIDSAFEAFRFDVAFVLIVITALLNVAIESVARRMRLKLHLRIDADSTAPSPAL